MNVEPWWRARRYGVALTLASTATLTAVLAPFHDQIGLLNAGLLFLLLTLVISGTWGRAVGLFAAVVTNLALNFFFVDPLYTFTVQDPENIIALFVFLGVSVIGSSLLSAAQAEAERARHRDAETQVLLRLSRSLIGETIRRRPSPRSAPRSWQRSAPPAPPCSARRAAGAYWHTPAPPTLAARPLRPND